MFEQYSEAIKKAVLQKTENKIKLYTFDEMGVLFNQILANEVDRSSVSYPFIVLKCSENYVADKREYQYDNQGVIESEKIDFINTFPCELKVELVAYAENIQDLISTEEYLNAIANEEITIALNDEIPSRRVKFTLSKDVDVDVVRDSANNATLGKQLCFTNVTFKAKDCVAFSKEYHPAEIALDKNVQKELLNQVVVTLAYRQELTDRINTLRPEWYTTVKVSYDQGSYLEETFKKINENYEKTQNYKPGPEERELVEEKSILDSSLFNTLSNLIPCFNDEGYQGELAFRDYRYLDEYLKEMNEHDCDIKKAIELFDKRKDKFNEKLDEQKRKQREKERKEEEKKKAEEKREKLLQSKGDPRLNRFTDPVVSYFKELFNDEQISIFGGSSLMEWYKYSDAEKPLPAIVLVGDANFTFEKTVFYNCDAEGNQKSYYFNPNAMLVYYGAFIKIFAENDEELNTVENKIRENFTSEKVIKVPDYYIQNEYNQIKLQLDSSVQPYNASVNTNKGTTIYQQRNIRFVRPVNVYPYTKITKEDLKYNQRLQFRTVQQLQYVTLMHDFLTNRAISQLKYTYKNMFTQQSTPSNVWNAYSGLFKSADYREVSTCLKNRQPVNREKFDKVLESITSVYPQLYDKTMQGWTIEQIREDILNSAKPYKKRIDELVDLLDLPETVTTKRGNNYSARDNKALLSYIHYMVNDVFKTVDEAVKNYKKELDSAEDKKEEERRARAEAERYEPQYSSDSSGGGGILESAVGSYLGTRGIRKEEKKQTEIMREQLKLQEEAKRKVDADRRHQQWENNYRRSQIIRENQERRRKGLPELPIPPGDYR